MPMEAVLLEKFGSLDGFLGKKKKKTPPKFFFLKFFFLVWKGFCFKIFFFFFSGVFFWLEGMEFLRLAAMSGFSPGG